MSGLPKQSPIAWRALDVAFPVLWRRYLQGLHFHAEPSDALRERVLLVGNHSSWWDGFMHWQMSRFLRLDRPHYTVMLQRHLDGAPALRLLGGVGIAPGSHAGVRRALTQLAHVRAQRSSFSVSLFPQGAIWPSSRRPLGFQSGAAALARPLLPCSMLPVAVHIEPGTRPKPSVFVLAGPALTIRTTADLRRGWEAAVVRTADGLLEFLQRHGEESATAWPPRPASRALPSEDRRPRAAAGSS